MTEFNTQLENWLPEGAGTVLSQGEEYSVSLAGPLTLWCPTPEPGNFEISFECHLKTAGAAMLLMACARNWRGGEFNGTPRNGDYDDYNAGNLEMYTLGFNRTGNVSNDTQPNASTANLRRIGGAGFSRFKGNSLAHKDEATRRLWQEWDLRSLLAGVREFASGTERFFTYRARFECPKIVFAVDGEELFTVIDHSATPLCGGYFGLRCMTPGARYSVRRLSIRSLS
jgi:hypothetical protein